MSNNQYSHPINEIDAGPGDANNGTEKISTLSTVSLVHVNTHSRNTFNEMLPGWSAAWNIGKILLGRDNQDNYVTSD